MTVTSILPWEISVARIEAIAIMVACFLIARTGLRLKWIGQPVLPGEMWMVTVTSILPLGMVVKINREEGEWVEPGETVFRIIQLNQLHAEGFVNKEHSGRIHLGAPVLLTIHSDERESAQFPGRIVFVSPERTPVGGQFIVRAEIDNTELDLQPGIHAKMVIEAGDHD